MTDFRQLSNQFITAARSIESKGEDKLQTLCREIIDHPAFKDYVALSDGYGPKGTLRVAFNTLNENDTYQGLMAFIQTEGARAMAQGVRPECLADFLGEAQKGMSAYDRETFNMFVWQTKAGKALKENDPAAPLRMMLAMH